MHPDKDRVQMVEVYSGIAVLALILGIGLIQFARDSAVLVNKNKNLTKEYFIELSGEIQNARYFTTGHPYVWVEVTLEEILEKFYGIPLNKLSKSFSFKIDRQKGYIFVVPYKSNFDFNKTKLVTYEQYIDNNA